MENKVLATVGGVDITEQDIDRVIEGYPEAEREKMQNPTVRNKILEQLISTRLFAMEAREKKLDETKEFEELLEKLKDEVLGQMMVANLIKELKVTEEEEKNFYETNKAQFVTVPDVSAKHILVGTEKQALDVKAEIESGALKFEEAAVKYSLCPSKERGGDLGYFQRGQMVPEFEEVAFKSEIGVIAGPVETQFGWHLVWVDDKREARDITFEEAQEMIHNRLMRTRQKEVYAEELNRLSEKYRATRA